MPLQVYFKDDIAQGIVAVTVSRLSASIAHWMRGVLDNSRAHPELWHPLVSHRGGYAEGAIR